MVAAVTDNGANGAARDAGSGARPDAGRVATRRPVVVHRPSPSGGRRVTAGPQILGVAYGLRDVEEFLRRAGLEDVDAATSELIEWRGGGPDRWDDS